MTPEQTKLIERLANENWLKVGTDCASADFIAGATHPKIVALWKEEGRIEALENAAEFASDNLTGLMTYGDVKEMAQAERDKLARILEGGE